MTRADAIGAYLLLAVCVVFAAGGLWITRPRAAAAPTCWKDPHVEWALDFDFHTGIDGKPNRCGYLPARDASILPRVLGEQSRAEISDFMCYPLARIECPTKETP